MNSPSVARLPVASALVVAWLPALAAGPAVMAQGEVGPGEQRFNSFIYKASHNSYEREESLSDQIDNYNVWCVELDMWWEDDGCDISIEHFCGSAHNAQPLSYELSEIAASLIAGARVTVIYLEMKDPNPADPCYEDWPERSVYRNCIRDTVLSILPEAAIYTADNFVQGDLSAWPSHQELVRRGKNFMVILDESDVGGPFNDTFFFGATETNPPHDGLPVNTVLVNINGGCDSGPGDEGPGLLNDRWLYRAYPGGECDLCSEQNGNYWNAAIAKGFNFIATNCVDHPHTFQAPTHSPSPLYVAADKVAGEQYGTLGFPYWGGGGLVAAVNRASPMVRVRVQASTYNVPGGTVINRPLRLETTGGTVRIE